MSKRGKLYLIPNYLSEAQDSSYVPDYVKQTIKSLSYFLVENIRTSRRFLSSLKLGLDISELKFEVMDKRFDESRLSKLFEPLYQGFDVGVQSEAGLPGIADPGKQAVAYAHKQGIQVVTLPGASSIILGLISSGFNGQQFTFHGYLPLDKGKRINQIKSLEQIAIKTGYTQIFMETPYRNQELLRQLLSNLRPDTQLYIGLDLTGPLESIKTMEIKNWKKLQVSMGKTPAIFAIG